MSYRPEAGRNATTPAKPGAAATRPVYSVSELNETVRSVLEQNLGLVWVAGEISNLARPASGHIYFSLKDKGAQVRCAMFRNRASRTTLRPENGQSVLAQGRVTLYPARGEFQIIIETLEATGDGLLRAKFEQLKARLNDEGLFSQALKSPLPAWPKHIGVVTSPSGAALHDVLTVLKRRCPAIPVIVYPTRVQGDGAAGEIAAAIATANRRAECDVLIIGRGGGSLEDLWSFNEEHVARAIHASTIPTVSAVGHEVDFTIADLVADLRAATPSAAAELVSPDIVSALGQLAASEKRLRMTMHHRLSGLQHTAAAMQARLISPERRVEAGYQRVDELSQRLSLATQTQVNLKRSALQTLTARIEARTPGAMMHLASVQIDHLLSRLQKSILAQISERTQKLTHFDSVLRALGPVATLERGYAIVTDSAGKVIRNSSDVVIDDVVHTQVAEGRLSSRVTETEKPSDT